MMANNWQRLNLWLQQENKFDYEQHLQKCREADCAALPILEFAQKAGMISCAMCAYPELPVAEAYLKFVNHNQQAFQPPIAPPVAAQPPRPEALPPGYKKEKVTITFANGRTEEQEIIMPDSTQKQGCCGGGQVR